VVAAHVADQLYQHQGTPDSGQEGHRYNYCVTHGNTILSSSFALRFPDFSQVLLPLFESC
jgi:hypothetical protein